MTNFSTVIQIIILAMLFVLAIPVLISVIKNHGTIQVKNFSLSFSGKAAIDPRMKSISKYMVEKLCTVRQILFSGYLKIQKEQGCPEEILNENEDSVFVNQILGNIVWSGNGIKSIKSIIEKCIIDRSFLDMDYPVLMDYLIEALTLNAIKYINGNYRSIVRYSDGSQRERLVSNTEWVDCIHAECLDNIKPVIDQIMSYSRSLYKGKK